MPAPTTTTSYSTVLLSSQALKPAPTGEVTLLSGVTSGRQCEAGTPRAVAAASSSWVLVYTRWRMKAYAAAGRADLSSKQNKPDSSAAGSRRCVKRGAKERGSRGGSEKHLAWQAHSHPI